MHYCANPTSTTTATVVAVSDDAQTCASLGYSDLQIPQALLPAMTLSEGATLGYAIVTVWATALAIRVGIRLINSANFGHNTKETDS